MNANFLALAAMRKAKAAQDNQKVYSLYGKTEIVLNENDFTDVSGEEKVFQLTNQEKISLISGKADPIWDGDVRITIRLHSQTCHAVTTEVDYNGYIDILFISGNEIKTITTAP